MRKKPNGTYLDRYQAERAARREHAANGWRTFYLFECALGWGFVFLGSAGHDDVQRGEWDAHAGPGSGLRVTFVSGPVYS